ncbi:MAG: YcxB-like protein [Humisphaera sp.]|nr:YcxB-like protein [Humisphaera sp.]
MIADPMTTIAIDYTLTYEEFAEAYQLQRHRKRFLSGPPARSPWVGCGVLAAMFLLVFVLLIVATLMIGRPSKPTGGASYVESTSPIELFLTGLLPWIVIAGILWLLMARSIVERKTLKWIIVLQLAIGASTSLVGALIPSPASNQPSAAGAQASLLPLLPLVVGFGGILIVLPMTMRSIKRTAWDAQPQLQRPQHLEATPDRLIASNPLSRTEYQWPAVISFSEGNHVFVLSMSAVGFITIPKRAFADAAEIEAFRALLQSRTIDGEAKAQGFNVMPVPATAIPLPPPPLPARSGE